MSRGDTPTAYVLVRRDLPYGAQLAQVAHACLLAGSRFPQSREPCRVVVLGVDAEPALRSAVWQAEEEGVPMSLFYEPDGADDMPTGYTAACSAPINGRMRRPFRRLRLWQPA